MAGQLQRAMAGQSQRIVEIFLPELLVMKGEEKLKTGRAAVLLTEGNGVQHLGLVQNMKREDLPESAQRISQSARRDG